jgi:hypothetical protein
MGETDMLDLPDGSGMSSLPPDTRTVLRISRLFIVLGIRSKAAGHPADLTRDDSQDVTRLE